MNYPTPMDIAEHEDRDADMSAVDRLANICAALEEDLNESPFTREEWERLDAERLELLKANDALAAENAALREENERLTAANKARAEYLTNRRAGNDLDSYVNLAETKIEELRAQLAEAQEELAQWRATGESVTRNEHDLSARLAACELERDTARELLKEKKARLAEAEALRKDAEARSFYDRTASAHGFVNAPHWNDLAEETRQMYRDERAKRDAAMGESHDK